MIMKILKKLLYTQRNFLKDYTWAVKLKSLGFPQRYLLLNESGGYCICDCKIWEYNPKGIKHTRFFSSYSSCQSTETYVPTFFEIKEWLIK